MFPLGVVVKLKLPAVVCFSSARPSVRLSASVHSIREQPLHVKPPKIPVSLSPLLFQISSCLSQNLITMQKYEWDTASFPLTRRLHISNCNELLHFSKTYQVPEKDEISIPNLSLQTPDNVDVFTVERCVTRNSLNWRWSSANWRRRRYVPPKHWYIHLQVHKPEEQLCHLHRREIISGSQGYE